MDCVRVSKVNHQLWRFKMNKMTLSAMALAVGLAAPFAALAQDNMAKYDDNKDGMVSKEEFVNAMSKRYDEMMAKAKQMPAGDQAKMLKSAQFTNAGLDWFLSDIMRRGGQ
jgi:hypothetical protein